MTSPDMSWFGDAKFGMFIHWGLYAIGARGEWVQFHEEIPSEKYAGYMNFFEPDLFAPNHWAELAVNAGMKYMVFTAKHHEGFCLWDTQTTKFNSMQAPNCRRDLLRETLDAFRRRNIRIGIYYSLPDWHHPDFMIFEKHPMFRTPEERDTQKYTAYMHEQVRELMTSYGKIDLIWFDGSFPEIEHIWDSEALNDMIRTLQPGIIVNRLPGFSDYESPEQTIPINGFRDESGKLRPWEGCQVFNGEWGYYRDVRWWKRVPEIIQMLIRHVSRGGNLLLNIGPDGRGRIDSQSTAKLQALGDWMKLHRRSIENCTLPPEEFPEPEGVRYTWNPERKRLYVHFFTWPDRRIFLPGLANKVAFAQLLNDASELQTEEYDLRNIHLTDTPPGSLKLCLPVEHPDVALPVAELILKDIPLSYR